MSELQDDLDLALQLADDADRISLAYFRSEQLVVDTKPDMTPVSQADKEVEQAIRRRLCEARPQHSVLGEEFGEDNLRGVPLYATLLGLEMGGEIVLGVVSAPAMGRRWWAARGI